MEWGHISFVAALLVVPCTFLSSFKRLFTDAQRGGILAADPLRLLPHSGFAFVEQLFPAALQIRFGD